MTSSAKAIEKAMDRVQGARAVCLWQNHSFNQKMATLHSGSPPKVVHLLAFLLEDLFTITVLAVLVEKILVRLRETGIGAESGAGVGQRRRN